MPAEVRRYSATVSYTDFPVLDQHGKSMGTERWRVVGGTGNCCENYLSSTPTGTLLDFGGNWLRFSNDAGKSWREVRPTLPVTGGEGAVAVAPNGDIVGVAWDPWRGDVVTPFKYVAEQKQWYFTVTKLHQPFYDRPALAVLPGPFVIRGASVPYLSMMRGGTPFKHVVLYSTDGLNYFQPSARLLDETTKAPIEKWLHLGFDEQRDWVQPHEQASVIPLDEGEVLRTRPSISDVIDDASPRLSLLDPSDLRWRTYRFPRGLLQSGGRLYADSRGWFHYVVAKTDRIEYFVSKNSGRTWTVTEGLIPDGYRLTSPYWTSFRVNGQLGLAILQVHALNRDRNNQDFVFQYDVRRPRARLSKIYVVGLGDTRVEAGIFANAERFDFPTIAMLPNGRIAVSFTDSSSKDPLLAIQVGR